MAVSFHPNPAFLGKDRPQTFALLCSRRRVGGSGFSRRRFKGLRLRPSRVREVRVLCSLELEHPVRRRCSPFLESALLPSANNLTLDEWKAVPDIWKSTAEKFGDRVALVDPYHEPPSKLTYKQELVYNQRDMNLGLHYLKRAMAGGHCATAYSIGIIFFQDPATRYLGMGLLNGLTAIEVSDTSGISKSKRSNNHHIMSYRRETTFVLRKIIMEKWPLERSLPCTNQFCGRVKKIGNMKELWDEEGMYRSFCSQLCRWTHEYNKFLEEI